MKKFLIHIFIFFAIVAIIDIGFGFVGRYLNSHAKGGDTYNHFYIANEMKDSVLIFGSSRAIHHFNPKILEDSLGMKVYNCGLDGNGILYNYGRLLTILDRYKPKMIIYDIMPSYDIKPDDHTKYLQWQKRWYDRQGIKEIFEDINPLERYKMVSNLYRYNTSFIQMFSDNIKPQQTIYKGYKPLYEEIDYDIVDNIPQNAVIWDNLKMEYFRKFVELCQENGVELIISYSPWYKVKDSHIFDVFNKFAAEYNLPVIDLYADPELAYSPENFADASHLNSVGADKFTSKFYSILKKLKSSN